MKLPQEKCEEIFSSHLAKTYPNLSVLADLGQQFQREGYLKITEAIPPEIFELVRAEVLELLGPYAIRRDIVVKETGNTPRRMQNVSRKSMPSFTKLSRTSRRGT